MTSIRIPQYNIEDSLVLAEFVANVVSNQKDSLPASCSNADVSLDRVLRVHYTTQADKDLGTYCRYCSWFSCISCGSRYFKESFNYRLKKNQ